MTEEEKKAQINIYDFLENDKKDISDESLQDNENSTSDKTSIKKTEEKK